jgi:hypothetical protein
MSMQLLSRTLWWELPTATQRDSDLGDITLARGVTIRGVVRQRAGGPVANARVTALDALQGLTLRQSAWDSFTLYFSSARTNDKGLFELPGVATSGAMLAVEADGFHGAGLPFVTHGDPIAIELQPGGFVAGQVKDANGKPCAAWLRIEYEVGESDWTPQETLPQTSNDGRFRINLQSPHRYRVKAIPLTGGGVEAMSPVLDQPAQDVVVQPIRQPEPKDAMMLRIIDAATGNAVENVAAAALWLDSNTMGDDQWLQYEFESRAVRGRQPGEVRLPGPTENEPASGIVIVKATGYAPMTLRDVHWAQDKPPKLEAKLVRESVIAGVVIDEATGKPEPQAFILIGEPHEQEVLSVVELGEDSERGKRISDDNGNFRIGGLAAGAHKIRVRKWGRPTSAPIEVVVGDSEVRGDVKLTLPAGSSLTGKVKNTASLSTCRLWLRKTNDRRRFSVSFEDRLLTRRACLEADGAFAMQGLETGKYDIGLLVPHRSGRGGWLELTIESLRIGAGTTERVLDAAKVLPGQIRGKVNLAGTPIPRERLVVAAYSATKDNSYNPWDGAAVCEPVAADGTFTIPVGPGELRIELLDIATRVPLVRKSGLKLNSGGSLATTLDQELVRVTVSLRPSQKDGRVVASRLEVAVKHEGGQRGDRSVNGDEFDETVAGVSLAGGQTEIELFLPPLPTRLRVHNASYQVLAERDYTIPGPLAELEFTPAKGKVESVQIDVPPPPTTLAK